MDVPWIKSESSKATAIRSVLERVLAWRRTSGLSGASERFDHFLGCYGNPDSDIVFLAEIPSLRPPGRRQVPNLPENGRWKVAWKVSAGDKTFRLALSKNGFIPGNPLSNEPWTWHCWITDFVKCAERDKVWKRMKHKNHEMAGEILEASSSFLQEELEIIKPKMIVVMGNATAGLFDEFIRTDVLDVRAPHYARMTEARKSMYLKRFRKMKKWYDQLK